MLLFIIFPDVVISAFPERIFPSFIRFFDDIFSLSVDTVPLLSKSLYTLISAVVASIFSLFMKLSVSILRLFDIILSLFIFLLFIVAFPAVISLLFRLSDLMSSLSAAILLLSMFPDFISRLFAVRLPVLCISLFIFSSIFPASAILLLKLFPVMFNVFPFTVSLCILFPFSFNIPACISLLVILFPSIYALSAYISLLLISPAAFKLKLLAVILLLSIFFPVIFRFSAVILPVFLISPIILKSISRAFASSVFRLFPVMLTVFPLIVLLSVFSDFSIIFPAVILSVFRFPAVILRLFESMFLLFALLLIMRFVSCPSILSE